MHPDFSLMHCVELTCPECGYITRVARCQRYLDADLLVEIFRRDMLLFSDCPCPKCESEFSCEDIMRVNRSDEVL